MAFPPSRSPPQEGWSAVDKAQIFNDQFLPVFTDDDHHGSTVPEGPSIPPIGRFGIQVTGVTKNINPSKTGGLDNIPYQL